MKRQINGLLKDGHNSDVKVYNSKRELIRIEYGTGRVKKCEACGFICPLNRYRGHDICGYCIKAWRYLDVKIERETTWVEFLNPTPLVQSGKLRAIPIREILKARLKQKEAIWQI